jgi:hypothetical protein
MKCFKLTNKEYSLILVGFCLSALLGCTENVHDGFLGQVVTSIPPVESIGPGTQPSTVPPNAPDGTGLGEPGDLVFACPTNVCDPADPDTMPPGLNVISFFHREYLVSGMKYNIRWYVKSSSSVDQDGGIYKSKILLSRDSGVTWEVLPGASEYPSIGDREMNFEWTVPSGQGWEGRSFKIKIETVNVYGGIYSKEAFNNFTIDNTKPILDNSSITIHGFEGNDGKLLRSQYTLDFSATDNLSPITEVCLTKNDGIQPTSGNACWVPLFYFGVNNDYTATDGSKAVRALGVPNFLGFLAGTFNVRVWIRDAAGNVNTIPTAKVLVYDPARGPTVTNVIVANTTGYSTPLTREEITINSTSGAYIFWKSLPNGKGFYNSTKPIAIEYTTDNVTYTTVTDTIAVDNNNCGITLTAQFTGCFQWTGSSIPSTYLKIRVKVKNDVDLVSTDSSVALNAGRFRVIAGSTDTGIGGSAESAIFIFNGGGDTGVEDTGSIVVTRKGEIFINDLNYGIMKIDPASGENRIFLKRGASTDGILSSGTLTGKPQVIALDYQDNIIFLEGNKLKKITKFADGNGQDDFKVETIIASGCTQNCAPEIIRKDGSGLPIYDFLTESRRGFAPEQINISGGGNTVAMLVPLPNGDIYFSIKSTGNYWDYVIGLYSASNQKVYRTVFNEETEKGAGAIQWVSYAPPYYAEKPVFKVPESSVGLGTPGIAFNPRTGFINSLNVRIHHCPAPLSCDFYGVNFNPRTGRAKGSFATHYKPIWPWGNEPRISSRRGDLYGMHYFGGLFKLNPTINKWNRVVGKCAWSSDETWNGGNESWCSEANAGQIGHCQDGELATKCPVDLNDSFITETGVVYFLDRGQVRVVNPSNDPKKQTVITLFGQSKSFGDSNGEIAPTAARFEKVEFARAWGVANNVIVFDDRQFVLREVLQQDGKIRRLSGSGRYAHGNTLSFKYWGNPDNMTELSEPIDSTALAIPSDSASNQIQRPFALTYWDRTVPFAVNRENGDMYVRSLNSTHSVGALYINHSTLKAQRILGNSNLGDTNFTTGNCDFKKPSECRMLETTEPRWDYGANILAVGTLSGKLQMVVSSINYFVTAPFWRNCARKIITIPGSTDTTTNSLGQTILNNALGLVQPMQYSLNCDGGFHTLHSEELPAYIRVEDQSVLTSNINANIIKKDALAITGGTVLSSASSVFATLPAGQRLVSFNYKIDTANGDNFRRVYYCSSAGKLYSYNYADAVPVATELTLPPGYLCRGKTLEWDYSNSRLIFPFSQNGLMGIGEYELVSGQ